VNIEEENKRLFSEVERLNRHNRELWSECQARGEILDAIQAEANCSWWYGALYELRRLRDERDKAKSYAMREAIKPLRWMVAEIVAARQDSTPNEIGYEIEDKLGVLLNQLAAGEVIETAVASAHGPSEF
jgi:hypothetical protein